MSATRRIFTALAAASLGVFSAGALAACDEDPVGYGNNVEVGLSLNDRDLQPGRVEVKAGEVEFIVKNDGQRPHAFALETPGVIERTKGIQPGETAKLDVDLSEGTYRMYDPTGNYRARGVSGAVVVTSEDLSGR